MNPNPIFLVWDFFCLVFFQTSCNYQISSTYYTKVLVFYFLQLVEFILKDEVFFKELPFICIEIKKN